MSDPFDQSRDQSQTGSGAQNATVLCKGQIKSETFSSAIGVQLIRPIIHAHQMNFVVK